MYEKKLNLHYALCIRIPKEGANCDKIK